MIIWAALLLQCQFRCHTQVTWAPEPKPVSPTTAAPFWGTLDLSVPPSHVRGVRVMSSRKEIAHTGRTAFAAALREQPVALLRGLSELLRQGDTARPGAANSGKSNRKTKKKKK